MEEHRAFFDSLLAGDKKSKNAAECKYRSNDWVLVGGRGMVVRCEKERSPV